MRPTAVLAATLAALAGGGCKEKQPAAGGAGPPPRSRGADAGPALEPFTGTLTIDRVLGARDLVKPFDPWDRGLARLQALLGTPTRIDGTRHTWAVVAGDACAWLWVTREDGADYKVDGMIVGTVQSPQQTSPSGADGNHAACLAAAGAAVGPPEAPGAAGPPTDGNAISLVELREVVIPGRARWQDRKVAVQAFLGGVSTTTSGTDRHVAVTLTAGTADEEEPMICALPKGTEAPAIAPGKAVRATGTVRIEQWSRPGGGEVRLAAMLTDCTVELEVPR